MSPTGVIPSNEIPPILVHLLNSGFLETVELKYFLKEGENREKEIVGFPNIFIFIFEIESYLKIYKNNQPILLSEIPISSLIIYPSKLRQTFFTFTHFIYFPFFTILIIKALSTIFV